MIEKYYRKIIDGVPSAVIVADRNLKAVFSNSAFKKLFGRDLTRVPLGKAVGCVNGDCRKCAEKGLSLGCSVAGVFEDSFCSDREISRRVLLSINDGHRREVSFSITVKPLGGGLCLGIIDDAFELEIARELQTAKNIQQRLLPAGKWAGGKRYSYLYIPCREIGGDLPEVFTVGNSACGVIADVSGKGISAGMLTAFVKAAYDKTAYSPAQALESLSDKFSELNLDERNYITVASARIDEHSITYSMAGHNVPILLKSGGGITRIMLNSPPVSNWFDHPSYFEDTIPYKNGDVLVLLTDGVTESKNRYGEMFGIEGAIKTLSVSRTGEEFIKNLERNLKNFCGELKDDVTAIAFDL
ncbi:MAG: SpoIIE family protein phosphatase [Candidatus Coproplasma sp.]